MGRRLVTPSHECAKPAGVELVKRQRHSVTDGVFRWDYPQSDNNNLWLNSRPKMMKLQELCHFNGY